MALIHIEDDTCSQCGHPLSESMDPDSDPEGGTHRYQVDAPYRCHACTAIAARAEDYAESPHPHALRWDAQRVPRTTTRPGP